MRKRGFTQDGKAFAEMVRMVGADEREGREGKDGGNASTQSGAND